jgi:RelA/SpoT family (p)ppGpp synthetase
MGASNQKLIQSLAKKSGSTELFKKALIQAEQSYANKATPWGEDYLSHGLGTAVVLDRLGLDSDTIVAGLLHDALDVSPEDRAFHLAEIKQMFGTQVAGMVLSFSEVKRIYFSFEANRGDSIFSKEKIENVRKMFLAMAKDVRVVLIELASRIDRLAKIKNAPAEMQKLYANETLQIFAPIANRLGLAVVRRELEDLAFEYLLPEELADLKEKTKITYEEREKHLKRLIPRLQRILKKEHVKILSIDYRAKSYWSTYVKLNKYRGDMDRLHDLLAVRIITDNVENCYKILGITHKYFEPISEEIDDYIAKPKTNGYRSLHTTVYYEPEHISEIQIRTEEMHLEAEYGICAHWSYKENIDLKTKREAAAWTKEMPEFLKFFTIDFYENDVFAFTPKGDVIMLPKGSCPVDFAYGVHSEVGNRCREAKVNGNIVPLDYHLQNGDVVEIITAKQKQPSRDWLLFVKTNFAKTHIKKATEPAAPGFKFPIQGFIKRGIEGIGGLAGAIRKKTTDRRKIHQEKPRQIFLAGQKGILMRMAKCCNPKPGEKVKAYLSPDRAAVLHRTSCRLFKKIQEKFPDRIIDASWQ